MLGGKPMAAKTESGVSYDPLALDAIEQRFWRDTWESVPDSVAAEHGIELARFGPVQATLVRDLAEVQMINLLLGATEPGAVAGGELGAAIEWARGRGLAPTRRSPLASPPPRKRKHSSAAPASSPATAG